VKSQAKWKIDRKRVRYAGLRYDWKALHSQSRGVPSVNQSSVHIILRPVVQTDCRKPPDSYRESTRCYSDQNLNNTIRFNLVTSSRICGVLRHCLFL